VVRKRALIYNRGAVKNRHLVCLLMAAAPSWAASYYTARLDDPKAVYVTSGDGDAIQKAIDQAQEKNGQGIVFVAEGRYRITHTINVWPSIRVIGYGARRPVFVLETSTPGYQDPSAENYMVFFAGNRGGRGGRGGNTSGRPSDASPGTFYSAMSNIDIEIGDGNPGAVGVRGTYAQHCFLAHMDFRIGRGLAGVHDTGNVMEDVRFFGGQYGIWTHTPSPGWQFTIVDAYFEGQREAAIRERAAGLTMIRPHFRGVPSAITIEDGFPDELWIKDGRMEEIAGPAVVISLESNPRTEINMENVVCRRVPVFASFRESGKKIAGAGEIYNVKTFTHGLHYADIGAAPAIRDIVEVVPLSAMPAPVKSDLAALPPINTWANVRAMGAKGDGSTDDTAVFRKAIAENRAIYVPSGYYVISDTLALRPDTVLIGLHPLATQLDLLDRTPAFQGAGGPKAMLEAPHGGVNVVIGIGLYTNGINPRAVAAKWMAGANSLMNDVRFLGGHGTNRLDGTRENPYNNTHTGDPDANRRWDSQYPSLWVTAGGGGTFFDIWTPSTFAQAGMLISDTSTEGRVYQMSSEHHVRSEVQIRNASNWSIYALQTEEERGEGPFALPLEIEGSHDITVANFHIYRVISSYQPFPYAIKIADSKNIRLRNIHCYSNSKVSFDAAVYDQTHNATLRQREFAYVNLSGNAPAARTATVKVEKLAGGFFNIAGGAVDAAGDFYFVDQRWQKIYRWSAARRKLSTVADSPLEPVNLAFDKAGNLMVVSYAGAGTVYALRPDGELHMLEAVPAQSRPGLTPMLAAGDWRLARDPSTGDPPARRYHYLSPDGTTFIAAGQDFVSGTMSWGVKAADVLRTFGLAKAQPGKPFYFTSEADITTWSTTVGPDGSLSAPKVFANDGGESVTADPVGNVYIAAGDIHVYNPSGKLIDTIEVPERPTQLAFGGPDGRTLFITARTGLYSVRRP